MQFGEVGDVRGDAVLLQGLLKTGGVLGPVDLDVDRSGVPSATEYAGDEPGPRTAKAAAIAATAAAVPAATRTGARR